MELHKLIKTTTKAKKRGGQGHGTGRGKTSGRGTKGQKAKRSIPQYFEGGALPLKKRLPFLRGKGRNKSFKKRPITVNIKYLNLVPKNSKVTLELLIKHKIVNAQDALEFGVKILGDGELQNPITVLLPVSNSAKIKIEKAGGSVEEKEINKQGLSTDS